MKPKSNQNPEDIYKKQDRPHLRRQGSSRGKRRAMSPSGMPGKTPGPPGRRSKRRGHFSHHESGGSPAGLWIAGILFCTLLLYFGALMFVKRGTRGVGVTLQEVAVPTATPSLKGASVPVQESRKPSAPPAPSINDEMKERIEAWEDGKDMLTRVRVSVRREDLARALESLSEVQERTPEWLRMNRTIADLTFERKDYSNAVPWLLKVVSMDPETMESRTKLAISLLHIGDLEAAETVARWTLELSPLSVDLHQVIAESLLARGQTENALPHLRKIAETSPFDLDLQIQYARTLGKTGNYSRAVAIFEKILQQAPSHAQTYYHLAICHKRSGKPGLAITLLKQAVENCGSSFVAPWLLGDELLPLQEHETFPELRALLAP